jgi:hypothetical protein
VRDEEGPALSEPNRHAIEEAHAPNPELGLDCAAQALAAAARENQPGDAGLVVRLNIHLIPNPPSG